MTQKKYGDDFKVGELFETAAITLTEAHIVTWAGLTGAAATLGLLLLGSLALLIRFASSWKFAGNSRPAIPAGACRCGAIRCATSATRKSWRSTTR